MDNLKNVSEYYSNTEVHGFYRKCDDVLCEQDRLEIVADLSGATIDKIMDFLSHLGYDMKEMYNYYAHNVCVMWDRRKPTRDIMDAYSVSKEFVDKVIQAYEDSRRVTA